MLQFKLFSTFLGLLKHYVPNCFQSKCHPFAWNNTKALEKETDRTLLVLELMQNNLGSFLAHGLKKHREFQTIMPRPDAHTLACELCQRQLLQVLDHSWRLQDREMEGGHTGWVSCSSGGSLLPDVIFPGGLIFPAFINGKGKAREQLYCYSCHCFKTFSRDHEYLSHPRSAQL